MSQATAQQRKVAPNSQSRSPDWLTAATPNNEEEQAGGSQGIPMIPGLQGLFEEEEDEREGSPDLGEVAVQAAPNLRPATTLLHLPGLHWALLTCLCFMVPLLPAQNQVVNKYPLYC